MGSGLRCCLSAASQSRFPSAQVPHIRAEVKVQAERSRPGRMALLGLNFGWISKTRSNDDLYPGARARLIEVETLGHNVTSARGPFAGTPSRLSRHVAMAILEQGPGRYSCVVLLAPNLRFVYLPAEERILPLPRTPTNEPRPADHTSPFPQTADAPIIGLRHHLTATRPLPNRNAWD